MFLQFSDVLHNFNPDFINHIKQNPQKISISLIIPNKIHKILILFGTINKIG